jgi:hypothetical protein
MALGTSGVLLAGAVASAVGEEVGVTVGIACVSVGADGGWRGAAQAATTKTNIIHRDIERTKAFRMAIAWIIKESAPIGAL